MKITRVTENNIEYFRGEIGEFYRKGDTKRLCLGLIDEKENAIGAAVLDLEPGDAMIRYFAIADKYRGKGYGKFFMEEIVGALSPVIYTRLMFCEFVNDHEDESETAGDGKSERSDADVGGSEAFDFLSRCGFTVEESDTTRSLYDMEDVIRACPFGSEKLPAGRRFIRGAAADEQLLDNNPGLEEEFRFITSMKNRYGGMTVKENTIGAMLGVERFMDGARLGSIYIGDGTTEELLYLFDYAVRAIKMESVPMKTLYVDTNGEKLLKFEDALMKKKKIVCRERLAGRVAWRDLN